LKLAGLLATAALFASCAEEVRLSNARESPEAVAAAVVAGLAARDAPGLRALALTEAEFRDIVWPRLPASRPERNLPWDYVWNDLRAKSDAHLGELVTRWEDRGEDVVAVTFRGESTDYGPFRVHRESVVSLRARDGDPRSTRLFGSVIEMQGRFKVFSYVVD
jgi:hypothetical protein